MSICHVYKNTTGVQLVWTTRNLDAFAPAGPSMDIECGRWTHIAAVYDYIIGRARYGRLRVHSHWPKANAKRNVFFDFCRCSVWPLNLILYDLAVMSLSLHFRPNGSFTLTEIEPEADTIKVPIDLKDTVSILARNGLPTHFHKLL